MSETFEVPVDLLQQGRQALVDAIDLVERFGELYGRIETAWATIDTLVGPDTYRFGDGDDLDDPHVRISNVLGFGDAFHVLVALGDTIATRTGCYGSEWSGTSAADFRQMFASRLGT